MHLNHHMQILGKGIPQFYDDQCQNTEVGNNGNIIQYTKQPPCNSYKFFSSLKIKVDNLFIFMKDNCPE